MKALVSFMSRGRYPSVGSTYRAVWTLKTRRGINRCADTHKRPYRVELYDDDKFYGDPFEVYYGGQHFDGKRP